MSPSHVHHHYRHCALVFETQSNMASWIKSVLFGRQLSHGSDNEDPKTFEDAFQQQQQEPMEIQEQQTLVCALLASIHSSRECGWVVRKRVSSIYLATPGSTGPSSGTAEYFKCGQPLIPDSSEWRGYSWRPRDGRCLQGELK